MSEIKVTAPSPDPVLKRAPYSEGTLARIAHVNEAIRLLKEDVASVGVLPPSTDLAATTVLGLRAEVEVRLDNIESKLNALITALS